MLKINLTLGLVLFIQFAFSQFTLTPDSGFGLDYTHGFTGISTIYLNQQVANAGPMATPKCIEAIDEGYVAIASKVLEDGGNTTVSVLNIKNASTGANTQNLSLKNSDVIGSGVAGYCLVLDMMYNASEDKLYLVGRSVLENKGFVFRLKRTPVKNSHQFEFDATFDSDGKYWFADGTVTGICRNGTEIMVCRDLNSAVYASRFSNSGNLLTDFRITTARSTGSSTKIEKYPAMQNRFFVSGSDGSSPALWGIDLDATANSFSVGVSNLSSSVTGSGQFKDFCFVNNAQSGNTDILCVGSTVAELSESSFAGDGIYIRYIGTTATSLNLNYVSSFKNGVGLIGEGTYSNAAGSACSFKKIVPYGNYFLIIGTSFTGGVWSNRLNIAVLSSNGQILNKIYEANQPTYYSHFPDEFIVDPVTGSLIYTACSFQAIVGKLIIQ